MKLSKDISKIVFGDCQHVGRVQRPVPMKKLFIFETKSGGVETRLNEMFRLKEESLDPNHIVCFYNPEELNWFQRWFSSTKRVFVGFTTKNVASVVEPDVVYAARYAVYHIVDRATGDYTVEEIFSHNIDN